MRTQRFLTNHGDLLGGVLDEGQVLPVTERIEGKFELDSVLGSAVHKGAKESRDG